MCFHAQQSSPPGWNLQNHRYTRLFGPESSLNQVLPEGPSRGTTCVALEIAQPLVYPAGSAAPGSQASSSSPSLGANCDADPTDQGLNEQRTDGNILSINH